MPRRIDLFLFHKARVLLKNLANDVLLGIVFTILSHARVMFYSFRDTSARTKDLHLMKKLITIFKEHEDDESLAMAVMPIFKELQTYEIQKQCVQFISKHRRTTPSLFIVILDFIITSNHSNTGGYFLFFSDSY